MSTAAATADEAPKKKSKLPLIIALTLVALGGAGGGAWYYKQHAAQASAVEEPVKKTPAFLPLDNFTVNLVDRAHYLQAGIVLELESPAAVEEAKAVMPVIRSRILMLLSSKTDEELGTQEGKDKLSLEIIEAAREPLPEKERKSIEKVHFSAFVIQ